ncbi:MAG: FAD-dependent monooxygenase [Cyanobacteriota bacterium]
MTDTPPAPSTALPGSSPAQAADTDPVPAVDVLIVGAGPAGAALAWLLSQRGLSIRLIDRLGATGPGPERPPFRGEALMPSGLAALAAMGLGDLLATIPSRPLRDWRMQVEHRTLFCAREPWGGPSPCTLVPQDALLAALLDRCRLQPGVTLDLGRNVRDLLISSRGDVDGVRLDNGENRRARLVVAADGRASGLRHLAGLALDPGPGPELIVDWFTLPGTDLAASVDDPASPATTTFLSVIAAGALFSLVGSAQGDRSHLALVREPQDPPPASGALLAEQLAAIAPPEVGARLRSLGEALQQPVTLQVRVGQARHWHRPGLLLLGDAAHPMSPVRAQGLNMALRDALVADRLLGPPLALGAQADTNASDDHEDSRARAERGRLNRASEALESRRRPEITAMQRLQAQETRRGLLLRRQPLLRLLLATAAPWLGERLRHHWMHSQTPLRFGLDDLSDDGETPGTSMVRSISAHPALLFALLLGAGLPGALLAKPLPPLPDPPSTEALRTIQLAAQTCARDNTETSCARTRELADPLLDNAVVSASCKDSVFELVQRARVGDGSNYSRRERIETAATELLRFCRPKTRVVGDGSSGTGKPPAQGSSLFNLRGGSQPGP